MAVSSGSIKLRWVSTRRLTKGSAMSLVQAGHLDAQAAAVVVRRAGASEITARHANPRRH